MIGFYLGPTGPARQKRYLSWIAAADAKYDFVVAGDARFVTAVRSVRPSVVPAKSLIELVSRSEAALYCQGVGEVPSSHLRVLLGAGVRTAVDGWTGHLPATECQSLNDFISAGRLLFACPERIVPPATTRSGARPAVSSRLTFGGELDDSLWRALDISVGVQGDDVLGLRYDSDTGLLVLKYADHNHIVHQVPSSHQRTELETWGLASGSSVTEFERSSLAGVLELLAGDATRIFPERLRKSSRLARELMNIATRRENHARWAAAPGATAAIATEEPLAISIPRPATTTAARASPMFLLVTGAMRTGTTLMGELIYSRAYRRPRHPMVSFSNDELNTLRQVTTRLWTTAGRRPGDPYQPLPLTKAVAGEAYAGWNNREDPFRRFAALLSEEIKELAPARGPIRVTGMKTTHLLTEFDLLCRSFQEARLIIMVRDPRDTFASHMKRGGVKTEAQTGRILLSIIASHQFAMRHSNNPCVKVIRYEDLVQDVEREISNILRFIDVPEDLYDWESVWNDEIATNSTYTNNKGRDFCLNTGIVPSIGRYKNYLSEEQVALIETVTKSMMSDFGYVASSKRSISDERLYSDLIFPIRASSLHAGISDAPLDHLRLHPGAA